MCKYYKVGGCVRDEILNMFHGTNYKIKDIDFSVEASSYLEMKEDIISRGGQIFLEKPEYFTIRAAVPRMGACDFVLCRKDGVYYDGRRPDSVSVGTIYDDLSRRDFTMNAIAEDEDGNIIDPFSGVSDIKNLHIKCVGLTQFRFQEDYLRMLRAIRFSITKNMEMSSEIVEYISKNQAQLLKIAIERVYEELRKCYTADTVATNKALMRLNMFETIFSNTGLRLEPTLKV